MPSNAPLLRTYLKEEVPASEVSSPSRGARYWRHVEMPRNIWFFLCGTQLPESGSGPSTRVYIVAGHFYDVLNASRSRRLCDRRLFVVIDDPYLQPSGLSMRLVAAVHRSPTDGRVVYQFEGGDCYTEPGTDAYFTGGGLQEVFNDYELRW